MESLNSITKKRPSHDGDAFSRQHPKMPRSNRAKLFMPFDALDGFDETMEAETVETIHPVPLTEEMKTELGEKLQTLEARLSTLPPKRYDRKGLLPIAVLYFEEDQSQTALHKDGPRGHYHWLTGDLLDIDILSHSINLSGRPLRLDRLYAIEF